MPAPKHIKNKPEAPAEPTALILKLVKEYIKAKGELDKAKLAQTQAQEEYDKIRKELLPAAMEAAGIQSFKGKSGGACHLRNNTYFSVLKQDEAKLHAWLKENKLDSIIKPTIHFQTLNSTLKAEVEEGHKLPNFIKTYDEIVAVVTTRQLGETSA